MWRRGWHLAWAGATLAALLIASLAATAAKAHFDRDRHAPDGSYFNDGDRAAGVFGVLATGFAVMLGFVVFLAFESYDSARSGAEAEALIVTQQIETAEFLPVAVRGELIGELVCYARSVAGVQWKRLENGTLGEQLNPFAADMFPHDANRGARVSRRVVGVRPVARSDVGP